MLAKIIICAAMSLAFTSNAFALSGQGKFKKKSQKVSGSWVLLEHEDKQILAFHKKFDAKSDAELKLVLSKQKLRKIDNNSTLVEPLSLGSLRSNSGDQNYVLPDTIVLEDYKSLVLFNEAADVVIAGFDIPREKSGKGHERNLSQYNSSYNRGFDASSGGGS